jgi:hypothetical protein
MVIIYNFKKIINESSLSWGRTRQFYMTKKLKEPQPVKPTTTGR